MLDEFEETAPVETNDDNFDYDETTEVDTGENDFASDEELPGEELEPKKDDITGDEKDSAGEDDGKVEGDDPPANEPEALDSRLLLKLGSLGLSEEKTDKVLSLGSNAAIEQMVEILQENKAADNGTGSEEEETDWYKLPEKFAEDFDEDLSKELTDALSGMNESARAAINKVKEDSDARQKNFDEQMQLRDYDDFEDALDGMADEWKKVFGSGETNAIDQNSDVFKNRSKLFAEAFSGEYKGSVKSRVAQASKAVFAEDSGKIAQQKTVDKARNRQGRFIGKGANTDQDSNMSPDQKALANLTKGFIEAGGYE